MLLFPFLPHIRLIADGGSGAVADDRGLEEQGVGEQFFLNIMCEVFEISPGVFLTLFVNEVFDADGGFHAAQFTFAEALRREINILKGYAALFEEPLGLPGVLASGGTEYLDVHDKWRLSGLLSGDLCSFALQSVQDGLAQPDRLWGDLYKFILVDI